MDINDNRSWEEIWEDWAPQFEYLSDLEERNELYREIVAELNGDEEI